MSPRIVELWAYVIEDTGPDDEGVPAFCDQRMMWHPLIGADRERAESLREKALEIAAIHGKPIRLVRSTGLETVEVLGP